MGIEEKLHRAWQKLFPHRNPKIWGDEIHVMAEVMEEELKPIRERLLALEKKIRGEAA